MLYHNFTKTIIIGYDHSGGYIFTALENVLLVLLYVQFKVESTVYYSKRKEN